ncbi:MAG: efflux RND transporter periplasmic adaptor subunit, partial [Ectothiorhodospiraceae bacterium]
GGIAAWKYRQIQQMTAQMSKPQPPAVVASAKVDSRSWRPAIDSVGSLRAVNGISVTTEVAGVVSSIEFQSGERVEDGTTLVTLDDTIDQAALQGLIADRKLARVQYERAANLLPKRAVSQSQYDEARARFDSAQAKVAEQQARIGKKTIKAPFNGLLGLRQVDLGEYVSPGDEIVRLQALDPIYVDYSVPERQFRNVSVGQAVEVSVDAYPNRTFDGKVTAINSGVDEGTRSFRIRASLENPDGSLRPGMFAEVNTLAPDSRNVLTVPRTAISYNTYGDFVYRLEEQNDGKLLARRQQVTTGDTRQGRVEIVKGLKQGQRVVRAGLVKLRDGQPVSVDNSVALDDGKVGTE